MMWPFTSKSKAAPDVEFKGVVLREPFRYADIPTENDRRLECATYPQNTIAPISSLRPDFFRNRYARLMHGLLDQLPLSHEEIEQLLMPVINRLIAEVHLLPASESHHHSGVGGLFVHSIQCATTAATEMERRLPLAAETLEERYHGKKPWIVGAVVMMLIHDTGKAFDMEVRSVSGDLWNPDEMPLLMWLEVNRFDQYFVCWKSGRIHKSHELRSLRLAYRRIIPDELMAYLGKRPSLGIVNAVEDAIVFGNGPLADLLKASEAASIEKDAADRKRLGLTATYVSSPLILPILTAITDLIQSGQWHLNECEAQAYITNRGAFLRLTEIAAQQIHHEAGKHGFSYVPATIDGLCRVLAENNIIDRCARSDTLFWHVLITGTEAETFEGIHFVDESRLFMSGHFPPRLSAQVLDAETPPTSLPPEAPIPKRAVSFIAPSSGFGPKAVASPTTPEPPPPSAVPSAEAKAKETTPSATDSQKLIDQAISDVVAQMQAGQGPFIENLHTQSDGTLACCSAKLEKYADNQKISRKALEMLIRLHQARPTIVFKPEERTLVLRF